MTVLQPFLSSFLQSQMFVLFIEAHLQWSGAEPALFDRYITLVQRTNATTPHPFLTTHLVDIAESTVYVLRTRPR